MKRRLKVMVNMEFCQEPFVLFSLDSRINNSSSFKRAIDLQPDCRRANVWAACAREEWDKILACARTWIREDE